MNDDTLARWQFATTTVYHFLIVPLSIGLTLLVAVMATLAYRKRGTPDGETWDRATRFWTRIMVVLFALGVVTGIVQEFQFGMNWSVYSRFVGDIFGAPLAMEALIAFFLESTFLGMWLFGRNLLSPKIHTLSIWLLAAGTMISAYFILAANSFMQHPVGWKMNEEKGRAELTSIWKVLTNSTQLVTFPHTIFAAFMTAGAIMLTVSAWHMHKSGAGVDVVHKKVAALSIGVVLVSAAGVSLIGHVQGQIMTEQQPMKMAAAEALWKTTDHAPFSLFAYGDVTKGENKFSVEIPDGLSILATNTRHGTVEGINDIAAQETRDHGPGDYTPIVGLAYWTFRLMIGFGTLAALVAAALAIQWKRGKMQHSDKLLKVAVWTVALPTLANAAGWIFTETARQPWIVYGLLKTSDAVSPGVGTGFTLFTLIGFTALYGVLGVICFKIAKRIAIEGPAPKATPATTAQSSDDVLSLI